MEKISSFLRKRFEILEYSPYSPQETGIRFNRQELVNLVGLPGTVEVEQEIMEFGYFITVTSDDSIKQDFDRAMSRLGLFANDVSKLTGLYISKIINPLQFLNTVEELQLICNILGLNIITVGWFSSK